MAAWHILLVGVVGSTAYGLATEDSDVDRLSVGAAPTAMFHGLRVPKESVVTSKPDMTTHEVGKYARLALQANPTVTELMWLRKYEIATEFGIELVELRGAFLSARRVRSAYLGYASDQFRKLKNRGDGSFSADTRKRTAKHARHLARLCDQGYQLYSTGRLQIQLDNPGFYLDFGERVAGGDLDVAETLLARAALDFDERVSPLSEEPDESAVEDWLLRVRKHYFENKEAAAWPR